MEDNRYLASPRIGIGALEDSVVVTEGLIRRGYSEEHISLMMGGNFQRVLTEIWE